MNTVHPTDSYSIEELKFTWMEMGLSKDPELEKQLANYDFHLVGYNDTECLCINCIPRKSSLYSDNMFTYLSSPMLVFSLQVFLLQPIIVLLLVLLLKYPPFLSFSSLNHKYIFIIRAVFTRWFSSGIK